MTYRRDPDSTAHATTLCARAVGDAALAEALDVSPSRVRQLSSPMTAAVINLDQAVEADVAARAAGAGCPHFEEFERRLAAAGALAAPRWQVAYLRLGPALRNAVGLVLEALAFRGQMPEVRCQKVAA